MLRHYHRFFQSVQILRDATLVGVAFWLAYVLRFSIPSLLPFESVSSVHETAIVGVMLVIVWPSVAWTGGLYHSRRALGALTEIFDVCRTTVVAFLVLVTLTYFVRDVRYSRAIMVLWAGLSLGALGLARVVTRLGLKRLRTSGYNLRHVIVIGIGALSERVLELIDQQQSLGLRIVGVLGLPDEAHLHGSDVAGHIVLGTIDALSQTLAAQRVDQVIIALPIDELGALKNIMDTLSRETVDVRLIPDLYQYMTLCGSVEEFRGMPIINLQSTPLWGWNLVIKRLFDMSAALVGLVLLAPVFLGLGLAVRLSSTGPVFYRQVRVGLDGSQFGMLKFRTMCIDAEAAGAQMTRVKDPRCTRLGAFLRRLSLDELPQLVNVLMGDMSLVGPRPEQPCYIETFKKSIPRYALRHKIKAGMTGWAQINGMRGNTSIVKRIEMDLYYIENWSLFLDLKILTRTVLGGFLSPHAY